MSEDDFVRYASMIIEYGGNLSYFERCAVLAFLYFRDQGSEFGVIEV
jgi:folylpolyglutamate synthase/dihydropteroate synthase